MVPWRAAGGSGPARVPDWRLIVPADDPEQYRYLSRVSAERPTVEVILADSLNVVDLLKADVLVIEQPALARMVEVYA